MPESDAWDWTFLEYFFTTILCRPIAHFWRMTPRRINALAKTHTEYNGGNKKEKDQGEHGFIDQVI